MLQTCLPEIRPDLLLRCGRHGAVVQRVLMQTEEDVADLLTLELDDVLRSVPGNWHVHIYRVLPGSARILRGATSGHLELGNAWASILNVPLLLGRNA